jgi:hypothetical protein
MKTNWRLSMARTLFERQALDALASRKSITPFTDVGASMGVSPLVIAALSRRIELERTGGARITSIVGSRELELALGA